MRLDPSYFNRDPRFKAYVFLFGCRERLYKLGLEDFNGVDFTAF